MLFMAIRYLLLAVQCAIHHCQSTTEDASFLITQSVFVVLWKSLDGRVDLSNPDIG